jgi:ribosome maturation factor RimP
MIEKNKVAALVEEAIADSNIFLVDVTVNAGNKIIVLADSLDGLSIDDCVRINRFIEANLDREAEDYELEVSSPGIGQNFKVIGQYRKAINRTLEVGLVDGRSYTGLLSEVSLTGIDLEVEEKVKLDGQKKKQVVKNKYTLTFDNIRSAREKLKF